MEPNQKKRIVKELRKAKDTMSANYPETEEDRTRNEQISMLYEDIRPKLDPESREKLDKLFELMIREVVVFSDKTFQDGVAFTMEIICKKFCKDGELCTKKTDAGESA